MDSAKHPETLLRDISYWCMFITACISILTFAGWMTESVFITSISSKYKPISPSTILCLFIISVSFATYIKKPENRVRRIIAITCAIAVICICLVIFICFLTGIRLDAQLLFFTPRRFPAGYMAPVTAAKLFDISIGILFLTFPYSKKNIYNNIAVICATISILTGLLILVGYLYESPFLYRESTIPVSIPGAVSIIFLGMGLLAAAGPNTLPVKYFVGSSVRSRLARVFFPVILAAVFINDIMARVLTSFAEVNPTFARSLIAITSASIVGIIIAKLAKSIGTQIDHIHNELVKKDEELDISNERFKMIAENINEGFLIFDAKIENIIFVSSGYERIRGKSMEDFIKKPFFQFEEVYPEDLNRVLASYQNHKNGKSEPIEYRVKFLDGSIRWIEAQGFPVRNDFGEIINNISVIRDITERKQAEENLSSERDFSDVALNSLPAIFTLNDSTGKYLRWNKNFETITGYSAEEIISLHPSELVIGSVNASVRERIKLVFEQGFAGSEGDLICKNGKTIPYHFTGRPFYYKDIPCVISIGIDISERKKNALALQLEKDTVQKYLDIAGVMIVVANADLEIVLVNKKASEVIGYEEKEIIGRNAVEILIPEEERHKEESFVQKMITGEIKATGADKSQTTVLTKKGEKKVIEWSGVPLIDETGKITGIIASGEDVTERIKMQNMLSQAKNEWEETFDTINDAITIHDNKHNIIRANKTASKLLGRSFNDIIKFKCFELYHGSDSPMPSCPCHISLKTGEISVQRTFEPHLNRHLEIKAIPRFDKNNQPVGVVHIVRDISDQVKAGEEQRLLQSQFLHIQKMESIGRLAGGVAHDFNNILSGILGFSELALLDIPKNDPLRERIELIMGLGEKAGSLTHQLLAFSRKQKLVMKDINLNNVVIDMVRMLKRIIGEDIKLELRPCVAIRDVLADQGQMEQVLLNLAVNARDAMPYGGVLTIETTDAVLNEENIKKHEGADPGEYVKLTVSDTGCGMSSKVLENIFEPFYTTKEIGKGTGLGLATVYGIIKQHRGHIEVTSKPEEGSAFKIYLPASTDKDIKEIIEDEIKQPIGGDETILVADDEPIMLSIIEKALIPLGYRLIIANSPREAIKINETYDGVIDLLLTDIVMPQMNGKQLADIIANKRPGIKVVFMSGYPAEAFTNKRSGEVYDFYLQKPLRIHLFRQKIREVLDSAYP